MKVMVCLKQVPHQDARLEIRDDSTWIKEDGIKFEINTYDTYALEEALRIKDQGEAEVVVVSVGPDRVTQALRTALGMGADRAIHVNDPAAEGSDSVALAKIMAAVGREENPDLVFAGLMSDDGNFSAVPPMLAEMLGMPSATAVLKAEVKGDGVRVERELEGGAIEVVDLPRPCLISIQSGSSQVRYASLKGIMQAKKKPVDVKTAADLGLEGQVGQGAVKVKMEKIFVPLKGDSAEIVEGSADEIAAKLFGKIKELGVL